MATCAQDALRRAAERMERLVQLEIAHNTVEKWLGYEIGEEQAPWMSVLSTPYMRNQIHCAHCSYDARACMYDVCYQFQHYLNSFKIIYDVAHMHPFATRLADRADASSADRPAKKQRTPNGAASTPESTPGGVAPPPSSGLLGAGMGVIGPSGWPSAGVLIEVICWLVSGCIVLCDVTYMPVVTHK